MPTFDEIFAVMAHASLGDVGARVTIPDAPDTEDVATRFAIALNILLDDLNLQASQESKFRTLLEAAPEAMVVLANHKIALVNHHTEQLFGYTREELVGQPLSLLLRGDCGLRKDKSEFPAQVRLSGNILGIRDLSELTQAMNELEMFSYSVAHELRSPLRAMNGFSQMLLEEYSLDAQGQGWLKRIQGNAVRMAELIDALLDLSRVTRIEPKWERIDLSAVFSHVAEGMGIDANIAPGVQVEGDARLLRALAENLLGNAHKFGGKHVEFGAKDAVYFVRDDGAGFDMAFADKLFKPFHRLHTAEQFPGTGVGLATVQRIVHRHGGRIWAEGRVGQGATFYFTLNVRR